LALRLEEGAFYSFTARWILEDRYGVKIGPYSYGQCFVPDAFPPGVIVGNYVSIASGVKIFRRNHPLDWLSTHPFFFNSKLGFVNEDKVPMRPLAIEHDAWIGENVIIAPGCQRIGIGAVAGAGAVVTRDIPDFAVVGGVPARVLRMRFLPETCRSILASRWWERPVQECMAHLGAMTSPLEAGRPRHPLLKDLGDFQEPASALPNASK